MKNKLASSIALLVCSIGYYALAAAAHAEPIVRSINGNREVEFETKCQSEKTQLDPATQPSGKFVAPRFSFMPPLPPELPFEMIKAGEQGTILIGAYVTEKGQVAKARILQSTGSTRLNEFALQGAHKWRFVAGSIDRVKACAWISFTFHYQDQKK